LDLKIIGDPSLIKQDDWLYVPSPEFGINYNNVETDSQYSFFSKYGHIRMDTGDVIVNVKINSPIDIDTEIGNEGLMYPQMGVNNQYQSLFSGQYRILTIANKFQNGKFEQTLNLARYINSDIAESFNQDTSARDISQQNQTNSNQTNTTNAPNATPTEYTDYDATR